MGRNSSVWENITWNDASDWFEFSDDISLGQNQIKNVAIDNLASAPSSPVAGQIYHNTTDSNTYVYNGLSWEDITGAAEDLATVQIRRTSHLDIQTNFTDVDFDTTDVENNSDVLEHNDTNTDRIDVKEDGIYFVMYLMSIDGGKSFARVRKNDSTVLNGSESVAKPSSSDVIALTSSFIAQLSAGDFLSLQLDASGSGRDVEDGIIFTVTKFEGIKGDKGGDGNDGEDGAPGTGSTINVSEDDSLVASGVEDVNFGTGFDVTDNGLGKVTVDAVGAMSISSDPPATCASEITGMSWMDTDTGIVYVCDTSNSRNKWLTTQNAVVNDRGGKCNDGKDIGNDKDCSTKTGESSSGDTTGFFLLPGPITITGYGYSQEYDTCTSGSYDLEIWSTGSSTDDDNYTLEQELVTGLTGELANAGNLNIDINGDQYILWGIDNNCGQDIDDWNMQLYFRYRP